MAETPIQPAHVPHLARVQTLIEWMQGEQTRLVIELQAVQRHGAQLNAEVAALLQQSYGIDAQHTSWTLDTARGVIITPDESDVSNVSDTPTESK